MYYNIYAMIHGQLEHKLIVLNIRMYNATKTQVNHSALYKVVSLCPILYSVPPELSGPSGRVYVMEGSSVTKNFHYEELVGLPPANSFTWQLNGRPFHGNTRINLQDGNRTLSVRLASRTDAGVYMLTVNSGSGGDSLQLDLEITCSLQCELYYYTVRS